MRRIRPLSEGPLPELEKPPVDLKEQYKLMKKAIKQQKKKEEEQFRARIPYSTVYVFLILIVFIYTSQGVNQALESEAKQVQKVQEQSQQCLIKYQTQQCNLEKPTENCKNLLSCLQKKPTRSSLFEFFSLVLVNCVKGISSNLIGPIMLAVTGIMVKMIQILSQNKKQTEKQD